MDTRIAREPCARCGTTHGCRDTTKKGKNIIVRTRGERFGYAGVLCKTCYNTLCKRVMEGRDPRAEGRALIHAQPPCARCGTLGGRLDKNGRIPVRINADRFGVHGTVCGTCYSILYMPIYRAHKKESERNARAV